MANFTPLRIQSPRRPKLFQKFFLALFILAVLAGGGAYGYMQYFQSSSPTPSAKQENDILVNKVKELIELPSRETPQIATVRDVEKLSDQAFFAQAHNGDKVLIYARAQKAILYRPSAHKIIEVSRINLGEVAGEKTKISPTLAPTLTPTPTRVATPFIRRQISPTQAPVTPTP